MLTPCGIHGVHRQCPGPSADWAQVQPLRGI